MAATDYHCRAYGLVVASAIDLPVPEIPAQTPDVTYRVGLGESLPEPSHSRATPDSGEPWAIEHWADGRIAVEFPGRATFELSRDEVVLRVDEARDPDLVVHLLLDHVLPRVVSLRGDLMLHAAAAVGPSGRAHLFLGPAGAGKSTVVASLVASGWALLDDDGIRVSEVDGELRAFPGTVGIRLGPEAAAALLPEARPGRPIAVGSAKRRYALEGAGVRVAGEPVPVAAVYELRRAEVPEPSLDRLGFAESLRAIAEHGFHLADDPSAITRRGFERAADLAAAVSVWQLSVPHGLPALPKTTALIGRIDEGR